MRAVGSIGLVIVALLFCATTSRAEEVPLLDGHVLAGRIVAVTADGLKLEGTAPGGGTFTMTLSADHLDPHWWYQKRDAALGNDAKDRLELSVWATEHGLFPQAKAQFEKARKIDPDQAREFKDKVLPQLRSGIAEDLVHSAQFAMNGGKLTAANKMLQAVLTRFGDTQAAAEARDLLPTLQHRMDLKMRELAHWKQFGDDEKAREEADQRRSVTDPIVDLIRQGHNIMAHMPPMAAQSDSVDRTREAANEYKEALAKIDEAEKTHASDKQLVERLDALREEAQAGLVQSHVTAGDVYTATGNYEDAAKEAGELEAIDTGSADAYALRQRISESQAWEHAGIMSTARWVGRR